MTLAEKIVGYFEDFAKYNMADKAKKVIVDDIQSILDEQQEAVGFRALTNYGAPYITCFKDRYSEEEYANLEKIWQNSEKCTFHYLYYLFPVSKENVDIVEIKKDYQIYRQLEISQNGDGISTTEKEWMSKFLMKLYNIATVSPSPTADEVVKIVNWVQRKTYSSSGRMFESDEELHEIQNLLTKLSEGKK